MPVTDIISQLTRDEGFRAEPYLDSVGISTVGVGHNLVASPLPDETYPMSLARAQQLLKTDLNVIISHLIANLPWAAQLDDV